MRVFLSSPGDVAGERNFVRSVFQAELPSRAFLRGRVTLEVVSWDDPAAPVPITVVAGILRVGLLRFVVLVALGKAGRYLVLIAATLAAARGPA